MMEQETQDFMLTFLAEHPADKGNLSCAESCSENHSKFNVG